MKLYAISDLHIGYPANRQALLQSNRFAQVLWTPGNHDLWTLPGEPNPLRGEAKYRRWVQLCRDFGVLTPEDPYIVWPGTTTAYLLAPVFLLYDYTFRPESVAAEDALAWAEEMNTVCADELLLHPDPYPTRNAWCAARCRYTEERLQAVAGQGQLVLINHFPLRYDMAYLPFIPRFSLWCGTKRTENWHQRFPVAVVVYGHLHIRNSQQRNGVRFEEVSLGYPHHWRAERGVASYLRQILPLISD
jgi:3',5'-cyclic AMP phosphodiesterase CpdA